MQSNSKSFTHPMRSLTPLYPHSLMFRLSRPLNSASFCFASGLNCFPPRGLCTCRSLSETHFLSLPFPYVARAAVSFPESAAMHTRNTVCIFFVELWQTEGNRRVFHRPFKTVTSLTLSMWRWAGAFLYLMCGCSLAVSPRPDCRDALMLPQA